MDFHLVFDSDTEMCKVYNSSGELQFKCEMHDRAVNGPGFGHFGRCPRGTFDLGHPVRVDCPSMGHYFTPLEGTGDRAGIGIHGGGTGLQNPMGEDQGWVPTHGCLRVQNKDNVTLVANYLGKGKCKISVEGD